MTAPSVSVRDLVVKVGDREIVSTVSFDIAPGEILCLVGESGSGKSTVSTALLAYARAGARIAGGEVTVDAQDMLHRPARELRHLRGKVVAYVAQDPAAAFNPALRIIDQMMAAACSHGWSAAKSMARAVELLRAVDLPDTAEFQSRYPHQMSGGQLQRVGIAMAMMLEPAVLVLDEPTTGLDVTTQRVILDVVRRLCSDNGIAALYVTHDLGVVAEIADRVMIMLKGRVVEADTAQTVFRAPGHDYTRRLLAAVPDTAVSTRPAAALPREDKPLLEVRDLSVSYGRMKVIDAISFDLHQGECLAIVGQSGSGKSTLSKCIVGLHGQSSGSLRLRGVELDPKARQRPQEARRDIQYIFQSPFGSLNPRRSIGESIGLAFDVVVGGTREEKRVAVDEALLKVGLRPEQAGLRPDRLSGGERQRVAIARALVCKPTLLICDEVTSALDVVVQGAILDLLSDLRHSERLAMIFVTHNLAVVRNLADRVLVLDGGHVAEIGGTDDVLSRPQQTFTRTLVGSTLSVSTIAARRWTA